jgi:hypothetical protein
VHGWVGLGVLRFRERARIVALVMSYMGLAGSFFSLADGSFPWPFALASLLWCAFIAVCLHAERHTFVDLNAP